MEILDMKLNRREEAVYNLRSLYRRYGFSQFKMSKFEEYDLYVRNKDFLISDGIITFTDTDGKLLALKPDVTLSIIKNFRPSAGLVSKLYYDENVYRVDAGTQSFKEILQLGIECMGDLSEYDLYEVILLAAKSLKELSREAVLDLSHFGLLTDLIDSFSVSKETKRKLIEAIGEKNVYELEQLCLSANLSEAQKDALTALLTRYGKPESVIPALKEKLQSFIDVSCLDFLEQMCNQLCSEGFEDMIRIDFSVVNHTDYYNGIVFKGFIKSVPNAVLSGGQYDRLMEKMVGGARAIGFAVYLDRLEGTISDSSGYDFDALLICGDRADFKQVDSAVKDLMNRFGSVMVQKAKPEKMRFREEFLLTDCGVKRVD